MAFRTHDLLARASAVDVFEPGRPFVSSLAEFIVNWVRHYDPRYLFFSGGDEPLFTLPGWGILFAWTAPFVLIGFLHVCRRRNARDGVLLSWMLFYPVADALTVFAPHPQRAIAGVGLYEILAARGLVLAFGFLRRRRPRWAPAAAMLVVLAAGWQLSAWAREYFGPYRLEYARRCYYGLDRVFKSSYLEGEETVVVTQRIHRGPMQVFYHRNLWGPWRERAEERPLTPALSLRERGEERQQAAALQNTRYAAPTHDRWGRFAFGEPFLLDYPGAVYVLHSEERGLLPALDVIRDPRGAVLWAIVSDEALHAHAPWLADGSPVLQLLDVELSRTHARVGESLAVRYRLALVGECSEPLAWATHFFSGETLWPHNVTMELEHVPLGKSFDVVVETVVPEYAGPGEYRIFAGPYRAADEARLRDAWGADFHAVGRLTIAAGTPAGDGKYAWEREGRALLEMTPPSLPERRLARGERFVLRSEIECPEALDDPVELVVSFFTHGGQWDERRWLARGRHGREMIEIATRVPGNARAGPYSVHVGLYDPARERMLLSRDGLRRLETGRMHVAGRRRE
ncbi:hypothetical protein HS125_19675 [bacterium]|nr:hypothetical protein [bacterium]